MLVEINKSCRIANVVWLLKTTIFETIVAALSTVIADTTGEYV
tara:strand:+ start:333 stop:461 length:129 start_codon:yes stop_codon:yes gene_type:complete